MNELYAARKIACTTPRVCWLKATATATERRPDRLFPQYFRGSHRTVSGAYTYSWEMYVHWTNGQKGRVNNAVLCEPHHFLIVETLDEEAREAEAQDQAENAWQDNHGGRLVWKLTTPSIKLPHSLQ